MISENAEIELHGSVQALAGTRTVADDVAKADDAIDRLRGNVLQHRFECCQVAMDIAKDRGASQAVLVIVIQGLSTVLQSVAQCVRKIGNVIDLIGSEIEIVVNTAVVDLLGVQIKHHIA